MVNRCEIRPRELIGSSNKDRDRDDEQLNGEIRIINWHQGSVQCEHEQTSRESVLVDSLAFSSLFSPPVSVFIKCSLFVVKLVLITVSREESLFHVATLKPGTGKGSDGTWDRGG